MVDTASNTVHGLVEARIRWQRKPWEGSSHGVGSMSWFSRRKSARTSGRKGRKAKFEAMAEWVGARRGVEVFVEPKTPVTPVSMLLVASDGEFTRRPIDSPQDAKGFAHQHGLPIYDATIVGYPQRMRDFSRRRTIEEQRARRTFLDGL